MAKKEKKTLNQEDLKNEIMTLIKQEDDFRIKTISDNNDLFTKWEELFESGDVKENDKVKMSASSLSIIEENIAFLSSSIKMFQETIGIMGVMERRLQRLLVDVVLTSDASVENANSSEFIV